MAKVNINGKVVTVSDDPAKQKKQIEEIQKKNDYLTQVNSATSFEEAMKIWLASLPLSQRKEMDFTDDEIKQRRSQCREIVNNGGSWTYNLPPEIKKFVKVPSGKDISICDMVADHLKIRTKLLLELEASETSKSGKPDPIPSETPIPPAQPKTEETKTVENGTTKTTTKVIEEKPKPEKTVPPISTPSGNAPVASTQPAVHSSQANTNKVSEKIHILKAQKFSKKQQAETLNKVAEKLIPIESNIKSGGNQIISYEKDKQESIGSVINTFPCLRKDVSGEFRPKTISVEGKGSFINYSPVSYTEEVENTKFPCGTYSINVGNKYDLSIGAGGANISTLGNMRIGANGRSLISSAEEMNITSGDGNVNIRAGHNVSLKGDSLTLETPNQVVVNSNIGVSKNAIINGCAFIDGEVYLNHVTCPAEVQYTGGGIGSFGQFMPSAGINGDQKGGGGTTIIAYADVSYIKSLYNSIGASKAPWSGPDKVPVLVLSDGGTSVSSNAGNGGSHKNPEYSIFVLPHEHPFNNIPLSFTTGNEQMRSRAAVLNSGNIGTAAPIQHGYKTPTA